MWSIRSLGRKFLEITTTKYILFSRVHRTFTKTDHSLGHEINHHKPKRTEITQNVFSEHKGIKGETSNRKMTGKTVPEMEWDPP